jgi:hypothetical protein
LNEIAEVGFSIGFLGGYHLHRLVRLDGAAEFGLSDSSTTHTIETTRGSREVRLGNQFLLRIGPSLVLPAGNLFLFSLGGGLSYAWYHEGLEDTHLNETIVWSSQPRKGSGTYFALQLEKLGTVKGHQVGIGLSTTVYGLGTDGDTLHGLFDGKTHDRWLVFCLTLGWHS